jgi:hypothetical protein
MTIDQVKDYFGDATEANAAMIPEADIWRDGEKLRRRQDDGRRAAFGLEPYLRNRSTVLRKIITDIGLAM